jgi:hypothetical protein
MNNNMDTNQTQKLRRCPICGCTEHMLIGCVTHWRIHNRSYTGTCKIKDQ